jgi:GT2 family glycosyltransferase
MRPRRVALSVIVLSHEHFDETTGPCLGSLAEDPTCGEVEVLVVDNGSGAETRARLQALRARRPAIQVLESPRNLGFAGGNNLGLREAQGEIFLLLNSDTRVPPGMLGRVVSTLGAHPEVALLGAVTNAAGTEQRIFVEAEAPEGILAEGLRFAEASGGRLLPSVRLDFCCVALRRGAQQRIGELDERFGLGYYEDFDYCLRARALGLDLAVGEGIFVDHRGGGTFGGLAGEGRALLARNKARILEKHGPGVRFPHARDQNLAALAAYAREARPGASGLAYCARNRLRLARADRPRGWLKRLRYLRRLAAVEREMAPLFTAGS